jgi:hypothetical protein
VCTERLRTDVDDVREGVIATRVQHQEDIPIDLANPVQLLV